MNFATETKKPVVQIGPVCEDPTESVSSVNKILIGGLSERYEFVTSSADRKYGTTKQSRLNAWNLYYLIKHCVSWLWTLARKRPAVAHYGITTGWALEKGFVFLRIARLFGAKTVGHLHAGDFIEYWEALSGWRKRFAIHEFARMDAFIVLSDSWRRRVAECGVMGRDKLFVVNNPICREFEEAALQIPIERSKNVIFSLGVMSRDKGLLEIVDAAALVSRQRSDFEVILAGPEREPGILAKARETIDTSSARGQVSLLPGVRGEAKLDLFRKASIFLLPSYMENFPLVVLEAAAAGHAIIATRVGATPEFFEDGVSALYVNLGDAEGLARAIIRLLDNPLERRRLANNARRVFTERLGRSGIMTSLDKVYSHVCRSVSTVDVDRGFDSTCPKALADPPSGG